MIKVKTTRDVRADKLREATNAELADQAYRIERNEAITEYVAMMADVEIPEEEDNE